jgi:seryl-tRNA synthetase
MSRRSPSKAFSLLWKRSFSTDCRLYQHPLPSIAPRQFPNTSHLRLNTELYEDNAVLRNYAHKRDAVHQIAEALNGARDLNAALRDPRARVKELESCLPRATKAERDSLLEEIGKVKPKVDALVKEAGELSEKAHHLALGLPNLTSPQTPRAGEPPKVLNYINYSPDVPVTYPKSADHSSIGEKLNILDFTSASTTTGWGFYYLLNEAALLEQALIQYALSVAIRHGWTVVTPPSLVYSHMAESCGFQPRDQNDEQQIWQVAQPTKDLNKPPRSLAATAEIPLAALKAGKDISEKELPLKVVGTSRCYRAEAGARGVDTKGLYRVHEFTKVELFGWASPPSNLDTDVDMDAWVKPSTALFDEMLAIQTEILASLGLPCRVLEMPASDLGASAYRKIDIEAQFPSRMGRDGGWGELTSASICTDYQSRRLNTRVSTKVGGRSKFAHTVNGTAVAIPRVLAALLEHGWLEDEQAVVVPKVLQSYMGGLEKVHAKT